MKFIVPALVTLVFAVPAYAQNSAAVAPVISDGALYQQFGGHDGLVRITDDLFVNVMADGRINGYFEEQKIPHIKDMLVEQFCVITGGGCTYTGKDTQAAHKDLGVTQEAFFALVEDLQKAMDKNNVPFTAQNQLLAALAPQSRDIVAPPAG